MANVVIDNSNLTNIAEEIRKKKGVETTYKPSEMAEAIASIQTYKPEETFTATPLITAQTITPTAGYVFSSGTVNAIYAEIDTAAGMDAVNIDANLGKMYKYTGTTDTNYDNNSLYILMTAPVTIPTVTGDFTYDGTVKTATITNFDATVSSKTGTETTTEAGTYTITFTLFDGYAWTDGTTAAKSFTWSIARASVGAKPVTPEAVTYDGHTHNNGYETPAGVNMFGVGYGINAGTYTARYVPDNNHMWSDETYNEVSIALTINKAAGTLSISPTIISLNDSSLSADITVTSNCLGTITCGTLTGITTSINNRVITVTGDGTKISAGSLSINVIPDDNHTMPTAVTATINAFLDLLVFTANTTGSTVGMSVQGTPTLGQNFSYSIDNGSTWTAFIPGTTTITLANVGDKVYFKGNNPNGVSESSSIYYKFIMTGSITASGNIMSLIDNGACNTVIIPNNYCFYSMFYGCTVLTTAPALPATTLTKRCYESMFSGCTSLTTVHELPAITLADSCYNYMFYRCTALQVYSSSGVGHTYAWRIPASGTASRYTSQSYMFYGTTGDFSYKSSVSLNTTVYTQNKPISATPWLCFTANTAGSTVGMSVVGTPTLGQNFSYSTDGTTWTTFTPRTTTITLTNVGDKVYFKGNNPNGVNELSYRYYYFVMTGSIAGSGDIMSLIDNGKCSTLTIPNEYCFTYIFSYCTSLTTAPVLPATTITRDCYLYMFSNCTSLKTVPALPATTLEWGCYQSMFWGCTSLKTGPVLPATILNDCDCCYHSMFQDCTSLTTAPALPATTLTTDNCYAYMFAGCTSLTTAPALPATTLTDICYAHMFWGCTALTTPPALPATTLANNCYDGMFQGCTALRVYSSSGTGHTRAWAIPTSGTASLYIEQSQMFYETIGDYSSSDTVTLNTTFYTQNTPV